MIKIFNIIFSCIVFTLNTASQLACTTCDFKDNPKKVPFVPHYDMRFPDAYNFLNEDQAITCMNTWLASLSDPSVPSEIKRLLSGCEVRPNGLNNTPRGNSIYYLRIKPAKAGVTPNSHWVIKQLSQGLESENNDLNNILQLLHSKKFKPGFSNRNFSFAMPECTFTITGPNDTLINFTLYHRVKGKTTYEHSKETESENALNLGRGLLAFHDILRPTKQEIAKIAIKTDQVNVTRFYVDSATQSFAKVPPELLQATDPLCRMMLTRCMGDFHSKNLMLRGEAFWLVDYLSLARDITNCSSFVNDLSYAIFCNVYFYGRDFIGKKGINFSSHLLAGYFEKVHPQYHGAMLQMVKRGFVFFVSELTSSFNNDDDPSLIKLDIPTNPYNRNKFISVIKRQLKTIFFQDHGIQNNSTDEAILAAVKDFCSTRKHLKSGFIDSVLEGATRIIASTPWMETQKTSLAKAMSIAKQKPGSHCIFSSETMHDLLARLARLSPEQAIDATDETKQKLPIGLACMLASATINPSIQTLGKSFTAVRERTNYPPRTTARIYGPYTLDISYIQSLKIARERLESAQAIARITRGTQVTTLLLPEVIQCSDGAYLTYQGLDEVQSAADLLILSQQPDAFFPEYYHAAKMAEHLNAFRIFGTQLFNLHLAARKAHLAPEEITKALGRPSHPTIASYLLVPSVVPNINSVFFSSNKQRTFIDWQTTQVLSSREKFTKDVYGFIHSAFTCDSSDITIAYVSAFLEGYFTGVPDAIAREHMLPDLRLAFLRSDNNLFESIIAKTKFASFAACL